MSAHLNVFNPEAYQAGFQAGTADRRVGFKSDYSWNGVELDQVYTYSWHYSRGYRDAWKV